jgi:hypothetical protein
MALRVQCSYRCRGGRLALHLKRQARKSRLEYEAAERVEMEKAARMIQRRFRGLEGYVNTFLHVHYTICLHLIHL